MKHLIALAVLALNCLGADKKIAPARAGNDAVDIKASVIVDRQEIAALLGKDPGFDLIAIRVELLPKSDAKLTFSRDMFTLISRKDGQRSAAMHPSQIAGSGMIRVAHTGQRSGGGMLGERQGPIWGGVPGTGDRPRRIGGDDTNVIGDASAAETTSEIKSEANENPVLAALKAHELRLEPTAEAVSGLLYYLLEGKHKLKDLELLYTGPGGRMLLDFEK